MLTRPKRIVKSNMAVSEGATVRMQSSKEVKGIHALYAPVLVSNTASTWIAVHEIDSQEGLSSSAPCQRLQRPRQAPRWPLIDRAD
jgi:hypothetical protein